MRLWRIALMALAVAIFAIWIYPSNPTLSLKVVGFFVAVIITLLGWQVILDGEASLNSWWRVVAFSLFSTAFVASLVIGSRVIEHIYTPKHDFWTDVLPHPWIAAFTLGMLLAMFIPGYRVALGRQNLRP